MVSTSGALKAGRSIEEIKDAVANQWALIRVEASERVTGYCQVRLFKCDEYSCSHLDTEYNCVSIYRQGDTVLDIGAFVADNKSSIGQPWTFDLGRFLKTSQLARDLQAARAKGNPVIVTYGSYSEDPKIHKMVTYLVRCLFDGKNTVIHTRKAPCLDECGLAGNVILMHVDPMFTPHQLDRLRSNLYLIKEAEQKRLLQTRIGIVGLSTGSVVLECLLREGIGGQFCLADFDTFEISNANRMLFGVEEVGMSKLELCTARVRSVDPALRVVPFPNGLVQDNVREFVRRCDIIIEECDSFDVKYLVRQIAKEERRPVLMGTSQRGMMDVERYDIDELVEPFLGKLPSFLQGNRDLATAPLTTEEKKEVLLHMFQKDELSPRFLESLDEIGKGITSWPQLAEDVFLNAATLTHASRHILLGTMQIPSGRIHVDMARLFDEDFE